MGFLELQQARGLYSRVTTGMPILNGSLLVKSGHLSRYAHLSMCQKDVRPSFQKRWRTMAFSRVSTGRFLIEMSSLVAEHRL